MKKETFKTILLICLFALCTALTQQLWINLPLTEVALMSEAAKNNLAAENIKNNMMHVINPQSFTINFGDFDSTVLFSDTYQIWQDIRAILPEYFSEKTEVEEISRQDWETAYQKKSVKLDFGYKIPAHVLRDVVQGGDSGIYKKVTDIDSILVPAGEDYTLYLANAAEDKYYKAGCKGGSNGNQIIAQKISEIKTENQYESYKSIKEFWGVENPVLMPIPSDQSYASNSKLISKLVVEPEINENRADYFAGTFFGTNFDFIRKITETNGTIIYMYGYGQRTLKIYPSGLLEYLEEENNTKSGSTMVPWDAVKIGIDFIKKHGDFPKSEDGMYLRAIQPIEKKNGYILLFGYRMNKLPVYVDHDLLRSPIELEVMNHQVTSYKRYIKEIKKENIENVDILPPYHILLNIEKNKNMIAKKFAAEAKEGTKQGETVIRDVTNQIFSSIRSIEMGYFDKDDKMIPVWVITIGKDVYYFDIYTGLNYTD
ncbi:MAG: two-component system activity regulator YycH [Bacillota bacterium]